jgi:hypothetical protein
VAIMSHLILQKPHAKVKCKEVKLHFDRRMDLWRSGRIDELLVEARLLQSRLEERCQRFKGDDDLTRTFTNLMLQGKVNAAIRLLSENSKGGVLPLSPEVHALLQQQHPLAEGINEESLLSGCVQQVNPILFAGVTADVIRNSAMHTSGAAGPSGGDADQWRYMCTSFHEASSNLCEAMALVARRPRPFG